MNMERRSSLFVVTYFAIGLLGGWIIGSVAPVNGLKPTHIKAEYYLELRPNDRAVIEDIGGYTYECHMDSIPAVLLRDNL
jgi:hypothetical protein